MLLIYPYTYLCVRVGFASVALRAPPGPDKTNERTRPRCTGSRGGRISRIRSFLERVCQLCGPKVVRLEASCKSIWAALGSQFGSRGAFLGVSCEYSGRLLGVLMDLCAGSLSAWTSQRYEQKASQALPSCPPPGPELHFSFGGGGALVREGGFVQC